MKRTITEPERMMQTICKLKASHEMFLESYPEDIKTPEGQRYCLNNVIRETMSLLSDISHRLIVEKDLDPATAEDYYCLIMSNGCEMMDKYTGRDLNWYARAIEEMSDELLEKEGDNNEML